ncbi:MAG: hypothetical protein RIB65_11175 [Ilumatobacter fluminis]|uniref:hypothetical protein n=1 Tax=Ilumatobacter fluminis TaxID=467091 RepID=UPI0032EDC3D5
MNRLLTGLPVLLIVVAACSGDDTADPTATPGPTPTTAAPSTTAPPTTEAPTTPAPSTSTTVSSGVPPTTTEPTTTPPPPSTSNSTESYPFPTTPTGQPDWVPILQELLEAGTALSREPNLDQITTYCLDNSDCFEDWRAYIENLIADDAHAEGLVPDRVLSVEISPSQGEPEAP